jgi:peptidoglycan-N-acetylglucosamine deacetylase
MMIQPPYLIRKIFSDFIWRFSSEEKNLYLTFDDGPEPLVTPIVLDILKEHEAFATFFCVGENVKKHPHIYTRILAEGHSVGNHTFNHLNGWKTSSQIYLRNIEACENLMPSKLFRPPYGKLTGTQAISIKNQYTIIMWDVLSRDYNAKIKPDDCLNNILKYCRNGSIILMHDSIKAKENVLYALPKMLQHFKNSGFDFKSINISEG